jgi:gamma-glutamyltranspeptidase/glutathione hydrolase
MGQTEIFASAAVTAPHGAATQSGQTILAMGGTAVEAMVAMAATLSVAYPHLSGLGGDGFWLVREPKGRVLSFEASGLAAKAASPDPLRKLGHVTMPRHGLAAALTVPGAVSGWQLALDYARATGGRLPLSDLLRDAISLARQGAAVSPSQNRQRVPIEAPGFATLFLDAGEWPKDDAIRRYEKLADILEQLAHAGLRDFYDGDVAREIGADCEALRHLLTREDFAKQEAKVREPLALKVAGRSHYAPASSTQGLAALLLLGVYERKAIKRCDNADHLHVLIEASKRAYKLRDALCVDPAFADHRAADSLASPLIERESEAVDMARAASWPAPTSALDGVFMSASDAHGTIVAYSQSIGTPYGSGCVLPRTGILLNNHAAHFSLDPRSPQLLQARKRPLQKLSPALCVFDDGRVLAYGSMSGDAQPASQALIASRIALGMDVATAIAAPRFHAHNGSLQFEEGLDPTVLRELSKRGHEISEVARSETFGHAGALLRDTKGRIAAAHDPRGDGGVRGL